MSSREIPDKLYFRIGEVARLCDVPAYVLRFWETEFPQLRPNKGGTGQRLFRRRDVEMALRIKTLLYDEGYTIAGARQAFKTEARAAGKEPGLAVVSPAQPTAGEPASPPDTGALQALRKELRELHAMLSRPAGAKPVGAAVRPIRAPRPVPVAPALPEPVPFARPRLMKPAPRRTDDLFGALFDLGEPDPGKSGD